MLDKILDFIADHIIDTVIEEGTIDGWEYRKWSSGIAECWGHFEKTNASPIGANHYQFRIYYPFTFIGTPVLNVTGRVGDEYSYVSWLTFDDNYSTIYFDSDTTATNTLLVNAYAIGRWKSLSGGVS